MVRGARVIGTASRANHECLRSLGAEPVVAWSGVLPELIELASGPEHIVTIADFGEAQEHGVTFSSGNAGRPSTRSAWSAS